MIRILLSLSQWHTTNRPPRSDSPKVTNRCSSAECSGSSIVNDNGSSKTVEASSKETPCFSAFDLAFAGSHSNPMNMAFGLKFLSYESIGKRDFAMVQ